MSKIAILMAEGCEEIEALTVVDVVRRAGMEGVMVSITEVPKVIGSHGIAFDTDTVFADVDWDGFDGVVLPGGLRGTQNLGASSDVERVVMSFAQKDRLVAAICAAPSVLGKYGLLKGKRATSYPDFANQLQGAQYCDDEVVRDGNVITGRGMGAAIAFSLEIVAYFTDEGTASELGRSFMYKH